MSRRRRHKSRRIPVVVFVGIGASGGVGGGKCRQTRCDCDWVPAGQVRVGVNRRFMFHISK